MSQRLVGYGVSQVPTNGMLGGMAYQDPINVTVNNISVDSGTLTVSAGTTALPSISPSGDSNTGIFFPAADAIAVSTGGTERVRVDSSGNINIDGGGVFYDATNNRLAIGTTGPLAKLDVISSTLPQVYFSSSEADGATKYLSIASRQRNSAAEPEGVSVIAAECSAGDNTIHIGGYLGELNAATVIKLYTANSLTTRSGSERFFINSTGTTTLTSAAATAPFIANIGSSEAARIDSSGRLLVGTTTQVGNVNGGILQLGSGITFPATAVAASDGKTLDDYEEGTWTPALKVGGSDTGITYTERAGQYIKIGKLVYIRVGIYLGTHAGLTGNLTITTLPFTPQNVDGAEPYFRGASSAGFGEFAAVVTSSSTTILLRNPTTFADLTHAVLAVGTRIYFTGCYPAA